MNVGIVAQRGNRRAARLAADLRERLTEADVGVRFDEETADALDTAGVDVSEFAACDLVVSIGGDGTFLFTARGAQDTPILGVNLGEVGFLNAVSPDDAVEMVMEEVELLRAGDLEPREVPRLAASVDGWTSQAAVNEVVVQGPRRGRGGGVDVEVRVDGSLYSSGHADGVLIATPTGSTAYNLSEGGPLVHPEVGGLIVTEMCAAEGMPPLVAPPDSEVTVVVNGGEAVVVSDGRDKHEVEAPAEVRIAQTDPPVRLAGPASDFFQALNKLN
ncbi:NAD+ kinase [Halogranum gelatinilyticum]|uniref:NAD kinase n=1 Tax=Halogranum gelatinilyticum TaxID=660521 RepID=A0A1G9TSB4_9EURY|nr:NAD(+)/NADH kinase [Halogranum gelatinilyticum]SDM50095.1 NAD+ kinase [Halogranum gelatinilyticum]